MSNGLDFYRRLFGHAPRQSVDRTSLPTPLKYLASRGLLKRKPRGEWAAEFCPVHKGGKEKNPSLRINLVDGHFRCMTCGESGGDLIALHRLTTGLGFRETVRALGGRFHGE